MNRNKMIVAGICGAVVLLVLTAMGVAWYVALAIGFVTMLVVGAVLRAIVRNSNWGGYPGLGKTADGPDRRSNVQKSNGRKFRATD